SARLRESEGFWTGRRHAVRWLGVVSFRCRRRFTYLAGLVLGHRSGGHPIWTRVGHRGDFGVIRHRGQPRSNNSSAFNPRVFSRLHAKAGVKISQGEDFALIKLSE